MDNIQDVNGSSSSVVSEDLKPQQQEPVKPVVNTESPATPSKGSQTPSENLYIALAEERRLRKEAEDKLKTFNTTNPADEVYSDEGKLLLERIADLEARDKAREDAIANERLQIQFPVLKELSEEFLEFQKDYPRHKLENVAKLFLSEKGLFEPVRKGLEKPSGGPRVPLTSGMTHEEVENLRKNDWRKYKDMLMKDQIKYSD